MNRVTLKVNVCPDIGAQVKEAWADDDGFAILTHDGMGIIMPTETRFSNEFRTFIRQRAGS